MSPRPSPIPDEIEKDDFRELTRPLWPDDYTDEDFERDWRGFTAMKRAKALN